MTAQQQPAIHSHQHHLHLHCLPLTTNTNESPFTRRIRSLEEVSERHSRLPLLIPRRLHTPQHDRALLNNEGIEPSLPPLTSSPNPSLSPSPLCYCMRCYDRNCELCCVLLWSPSVVVPLPLV